MFDIGFLMQRLSDNFSQDIVNESIRSLVDKGILEQYTDENGDFHFQLTKLGNECAEEIIDDPLAFFKETDNPEDKDGMAD